MPFEEISKSKCTAYSYDPKPTEYNKISGHINFLSTHIIGQITDE